MSEEQLNPANFKERTGARFRVNNVQKARIEITALTDEQRQRLAAVGSDTQALSAFFGLKSPRKWLEEVPALIADWSYERQLTREGAFAEFVSAGGPERLQNRKPDIPVSVYLDPELTLDNFSDKVEAATGVKNRRFRVSRDQHALVSSGQLTREQAFQQTLAAIRAKHQQEVTS